MQFDDEPSVATLEKPPTPPARLPQKSNPSKPMDDWDDEEEAPTGFKKYRVPIILGVLCATGIGFGAKLLSKSDSGHAAPSQVTQVKLMLPPTPPPPPPPPPPPQEVPKEQEMIKEEKQEEAPPEPAPQVDTALKGPGGSGSMAIRAGNSSGIFANRNAMANPHAKWSSYTNQAGSRILDALRSNPKTRKMAVRVDVRIWPDSTGRITRASIAASSGDASLDAVIRDEILTGLQLSQPPPEGMPTPIVMRVTAKRPN